MLLASCSLWEVFYSNFYNIKSSEYTTTWDDNWPEKASIC